MINDKDKIFQSMYSAIDTVNGQFSEEMQLEKSPDTVLFGEGSRLDSLGLVNVIIAIEQKVEEDFETPVSLTDERAMSQKNSPFRTVRTLADYIFLLLQEGQNG